MLPLQIYPEYIQDTVCNVKAKPCDKNWRNNFEQHVLDARQSNVLWKRTSCKHSRLKKNVPELIFHNLKNVKTFQEFSIKLRFALKFR